ncbi:MAG: transcription termination/antitermination protein NusA [Desulfurellaceae bacterium]|nr:transcription termination/antitermination protein NusA [Desulfurellaceae bacterium]
MQPDLNRVIEQVSKEKGMDRQVIIEAIESAMLSAARRTFGQKQIEAKFNHEIGEVELFEIKTVVQTVTDPETEITLADARANMDPEAQEGDELLSKLPATSFGRIAAQVAKQSVIQKVREAERELIYNEFRDRKGEIFSGIVQRIERKNIIVNLGRTDAVLPEKEQIPWERYRQGDRIRAFVLDVEMSHKGPQIVLSRTHPGFLIKLFEQEAPEVYEGIIEIKGAAREPGSRAKIAVHSTDPDVDPVGACVGMKGTRVQAVVQELRGERVDIVPWTPDPAEYVCRAILPAKVSKIILDEDDHAMEIIVPDDQLSLAIGKKGQNVRLASRLTAWRLDVRSESEIELERTRALESLTGMTGIGDLTAELLYQQGYKSAADVAEADEATLAELEGIEADKAQAILQAAQDYVDEQAAAEADPQEPVDTPDGPAGQTGSPQSALVGQAATGVDGAQAASEEV